MFARLAITMNKMTSAFAVDRPDDNMLSQSVLKRAVAGMVFQEDFAKLPVSYGSSVWEVACEMNPPVTIRALKPKFWLLGRVTIEAGSKFELV